MVGCDTCDGTNNHFGHGLQTFTYKNMTMADLRSKNFTIDRPWDPLPGDMVMTAASYKTLNINPNCDEPKAKPTICDARLRTMNTQARFPCSIVLLC